MTPSNGLLNASQKSLTKPYWVVGPELELSTVLEDHLHGAAWAHGIQPAAWNPFDAPRVVPEIAHLTGALNIAERPRSADQADAKLHSQLTAGHLDRHGSEGRQEEHEEHGHGQDAGDRAA